MSALQNATGTVLLVEDRATMRRSLKRILEEAGHCISEADCISSAKNVLPLEQPDLVLTDLRLPDGQGTELITEAQQLPRTPPVILITAYGTVETAVEAMKLGAYDFLTKPVDSQHLLLLVSRALTDSRLRRQYEILVRERQSGTPVLVGEDPEFRTIVDRASAAAETDTTVLVLGESGTGKELLARLIHQESERGASSFVPVNCAAISPSLAESALFGHEKGAFTGATTQHKGWFELAHHGTLFLDEIGDLELPLQGKLLRVLEDGVLQRVGGTRWIKVDVRVIAASNKELIEEVEAERFRRDLYYRLAVFPLKIPPLRQRPDDIPILAEYFRRFHAKRLGKHGLTFQTGVIEALQRYEWPGNVRELNNVLERAVILARGGDLNHTLFPIFPGKTIPQQTGHPGELPADLKSHVADTVEKIEREAIERALQMSAGNRSEAARMLGITYRTLLNKLKLYQKH